MNSFCMTKWVVATSPIVFFILDYQKLNFRARVVIQFRNFCFQKFWQDLTFLIIFCKNSVSLASRFFIICSISVYFFVTSTPTDSMKMLRTSRRLGYLFEFFGKRISYSFSILINSYFFRYIFLNTFKIQINKAHSVNWFLWSFFG